MIFHLRLFGKQNQDHPVMSKFMKIVKRILKFNYHTLKSFFDFVYILILTTVNNKGNYYLQ